MRTDAAGVVEHIRVEKAAREYLARRPQMRDFTSQLLLLTDQESEQGVARIRADERVAAASARELRLHADLHIYATYATLAHSHA